MKITPWKVAGDLKKSPHPALAYTALFSISDIFKKQVNTCYVKAFLNTVNSHSDGTIFICYMQISVANIEIKGKTFQRNSFCYGQIYRTGGSIRMAFNCIFDVIILHFF